MAAGSMRSIHLGRVLWRTPLIKFPERPSLEHRYPALEQLKQQIIPTVAKPVPKPQVQSSNTGAMSVSVPTGGLSAAVSSEPTQYEKEDGMFVYVVSELPPKYQRPHISQEEIEYIERGGPDV